MQAAPDSPWVKAWSRLAAVRSGGFAALPTAVIVGVLLGACGSSGSSQHRSRPQGPANATSTTASLRGPVLTHPAPEPPLVLHDYLGPTVNLSSYRGRVVLLTFIYTHCPDVCPLIVSNLHNALALLGPRAAKVQIIAVSTDPKGDTHSAIASFLARRDMTGRLKYLIGSRTALTPVWRAWGVSASNPTAHDEVAHSALVYGITASGKVTSVYPANFTAADIAHDVPLLAAG
jgi:protein SCO1